MSARRLKSAVKTLFVIFKDLFAFSLIFYLILFILENLFPGFVSNNFDLNNVLYLVVGLGFLSAFAPLEEKNEEKETKPKRADYLLIAGLSLVGGALIFYKAQLELPFRLLTAFTGSALTILLGLVILHTKDEPEEASPEIVIPNSPLFLSFSPKNKRFVFLILSVFVLLGLSVSLFFLKDRLTSKNEAAVQFISPLPDETPAPTPEEKLLEIKPDKDLLIRVVNGGKDKEAADEFIKVLKNAGFTKAVVGKQETMNFENATLKFRPEDENQAKLIKQLLEKEYQYSNITSLPLATKSAELTVILGNPPVKEKVEP